MNDQPMGAPIITAARGEAAVTIAGKLYRLRPTFVALVAAEQELGSLFALVDKAVAGQLSLSDLTILFWHCIDKRPDSVTREQLGAALLEAGLTQATPALRVLLSQIWLGT